MFPHGFYFAGDVDKRQATSVGSDQSGGDRVDPSPRDQARVYYLP